MLDGTPATTVGNVSVCQKRTPLAGCGSILIQPIQPYSLVQGYLTLHGVLTNDGNSFNNNGQAVGTVGDGVSIWSGTNLLWDYLVGQCIRPGNSLIGVNYNCAPATGTNLFGPSYPIGSYRGGALPNLTTAPIEIRICNDQGLTDENIYVMAAEITLSNESSILQSEYCLTAPLNGVVNLQCRNFDVITSMQLSYGTPEYGAVKGLCPIVPNCVCHTAGFNNTFVTSLNNRCLNKTSCNITANTATFGIDPCPASTLVKQLAVQYTCGPGSNTVATPYLPCLIPVPYYVPSISTCPPNYIFRSTASDGDFVTGNTCQFCQPVNCDVVDSTDPTV